MNISGPNITTNSPPLTFMQADACELAHTPKVRPDIQFGILLKEALVTLSGLSKNIP